MRPTKIKTPPPFATIRFPEYVSHKENYVRATLADRACENDGCLYFSCPIGEPHEAQYCAECRGPGGRSLGKASCEQGHATEAIVAAIIEELEQGR